MQDIAGCRLVVANMEAQDRAVEKLKARFDEVTVVDRRQKPSHGYRAVHVIVRFGGKPIEVQVRTTLQHLWAELSEKFADVIDPGIKYGGGPQVCQDLLASVSKLISRREKLDVAFAEMLSRAQGQNVLSEMEARIATARADAEELDAEIKNVLTGMIVKFSGKVGA